MSNQFQPLLVFAADLHLQPNAWVKHPTLSGDAYESFKQIVNFADRHGLPIVLGGDIFDKKFPDPYSVRFFGQQAARLFQGYGEGGLIEFVQGDHDFHEEAAWPSVTGYAMPIHDSSRSIGRFKLYGLNWTQQDSLQEALDNIPEGTDILVCHQSWSELQGIGNTEGSIAKIPHVRYVLTGDYHVHLQKTVQAEDGRGEITVISPGSTCMQSIDERYDKYFIVVGTDGDQLVFRSEPLMTRMKFEVVYDTEESLAQDLERRAFDQFIADPRLRTLPESISKPILRATFDADIPEALDRIEAACGEKFHIFPNPRTVVETVYVDTDRDREGAFETLLSVCRRLAVSDEQYNFLAALLRADHPEHELDRMYDEFQRQYRQPVQRDFQPGDPTGRRPVEPDSTSRLDEEPND